MADEARIKAAIAGAQRHLNGWHGGPSLREQLAAIAEATGDDERGDTYGKGERIGRLEERIAEILGTEAAVFMPSGTMAQQIALRIWSERKRSTTVAFHPTCHLEIHEQKGYQRLHGLHARLVGNRHELITLADLEGIHDPLAALLLELPQREIGGRLPEWDDLVAQTSWAIEHGIALHLDGARLWQCGPFYERSHAEIASLFDSVYVSFYKDLGGLAGAALAGDPELVAEARVWLRRQGGNLVTMHPFVVSAEQGLDERLEPIAGYVEHARELADALREVEGVEVVPDPPQAAMFHVHLRGDRERLCEAALAIAEERKVFIFGELSATSSPTIHYHELSIGKPTLAFTPEETAALYRDILAGAAA
jgi:threonine aldolase